MLSRNLRTEEYDADLLSEPEVIIDAGANVGLAGVFAMRFPSARILAIEPEDANFELPRRT
ncbi:MAG: hypothetical protein R3C05_25500 [Pirellulaceae bacterium]